MKKVTSYLFNSYRDLHLWLEEIESNLDHFKTSYNQAIWQRIAEGKGSDARPWREKQRSLLLGEEMWERIEFYRAQQPPPTLARRLVLLQRLVRHTRLAANARLLSLRSDINRRISQYPLVVKDRRVNNTELFNVLTREPDSELREAAWRSKTKLGETVEPSVRALVQQRNYLAQEQGYKNYFDFFLSQSGLDTGWVLELLTELEQASEQPFLNFLAQAGDRAGLKEIHPWDILYLVEREMALPPSLFPPERILPLFRRLTSELGFDHRAQELDIRIQDIPYNALTFVVSVPKVIYVISNPSPSYRYYRILFHEFGHALAARYNEQPNYLYKWEEVPCFNEGLGQIMTHFTIYPSWLREHVGLPENLLEGFAKREAAVNVYRYRDWLARATFENALYHDPDQDLQTLWRENYQRFYKTSHSDMTCWAEVPYYTNYPFHFLNSIIADVVSFQVHASLQANFSTSFPFSAHTAPFLTRNLYAPASSIGWRERIERATGNAPSWKAMIASFRHVLS